MLKEQIQKINCRRMSFQLWPEPKWCSWLPARQATSTHLPQGLPFWLKIVLLTYYFYHLPNVIFFCLQKTSTDDNIRRRQSTDPGKKYSLQNLEWKWFHPVTVLKFHSSKNLPNISLACEGLKQNKNKIKSCSLNWQTSLRSLSLKVWAQPAK